MHQLQSKVLNENQEMGTCKVLCECVDGGLCVSLGLDECVCA